MQKISRERFKWFKQKHYELWDWLSKNPDKMKMDWFALEENTNLNICGNCFACHFANEVNKINKRDSNGCKFCPICEDNSVYCLNGLYDRYHDACMMYDTTHDKAHINEVIRLTETIRDLPWSEEYVEDKNMNNENYIVINGKKAELTEEQLKQLGIEIKAKNKRWRAEKDMEYWCINASNTLFHLKEFNSEGDNLYYDTHNYFRTYEEAKEYAEVLEIKRKLMKFADEHNEEIDWENTQYKKYCLTYDVNNPNKVVINWSVYTRYAEVIFFSSKEIAGQAIDTIGKDNIIKYLTYNY